MHHNCYAKVLLDANGKFSPERFVELFLQEAKRENIFYGGKFREAQFFPDKPSGILSLSQPDYSLPIQSPPSSQLASSASCSSNNHNDSIVYGRWPCNLSGNSPYPPVQHHAGSRIIPPLASQRNSNVDETLSIPCLNTPISSSHLVPSSEEMFLGLEDLSDDDEDVDDGDGTDHNNGGGDDKKVQETKQAPLVHNEKGYQMEPQSVSQMLPTLPGAAREKLITQTPQVLGPECIESSPYYPSSTGRSCNENPKVKMLEKVNTLSSCPPFQAAVKHKLKLVLDLDNTLLHACALSKLCNVNIPLEEFESPESDPELYAFRLSNFSNQQYHVKFRPGVRRFLSELSRYCDLGIHTNATHEYADVIVSILDPDYSLFQGRVASREEEASKDQKKDVGRLFRVADLDISSLIILDDRKDVWDAMYHPNIVKCGMYDYLDARKAALIEKYRECHKDTLSYNGSVVKSLDSSCMSCSEQMVDNDNAMTMGVTLNGSSIEKNNEVTGTSCGNEKMAESLYSNVLAEQPGSQCPTEVDDAHANLSDIKNEHCETPSNPSTEMCTTADVTPFLDNPLVEQSQIGVRRRFDEAENFEDDDVINLGDRNQTDSGECHSSCACDVNNQSVVNDVEDGCLASKNADIATHFGVTEDAVTENMRLAMQLCSLDQALVDFDTQLDDIRKLIIEIALEYNRQKSHPSTADTVSVAQILNERRQAILKGVVVQTVGMYKSETSHPEFGWQDNGPVHRRRLVRLGAQVVDSPVPELTHIVAMRATQTIDRVRRERGLGVHYVHALWLHACESTWCRVPEQWFPAFSLLQKYDNVPPLKPWVDHWQLIALQNSTLNIRLLKAIQHAAETEERKKDGIGQPENDMKRIPVRKVHLVLSPQSAGAEVWSAREHITLMYNPLDSAKLKQRFSIPLTNDESQALASYEQQQLARAVKMNSALTHFRHKQPNLSSGGARSHFRNFDTSYSYPGSDKKKRTRFGARDHFNRYKASKHLQTHHRYWIHDYQVKKNPLYRDTSFYKNMVAVNYQNDLPAQATDDSFHSIGNRIAGDMHAAPDRVSNTVQNVFMMREREGDCSGNYYEYHSKIMSSNPWQSSFEDIDKERHLTENDEMKHSHLITDTIQNPPISNSAGLLHVWKEDKQDMHASDANLLHNLLQASTPSQVV